MTITETRAAQTTRAIPRPRSPREDDAPAQRVTPETASQPTLPAPRYPWPEPWRSSRGATPRSEFWDVASAQWHSAGPYPERRKP